MKTGQLLHFLYPTLYSDHCIGCGKDFRTTDAKIRCDVPVTITYDDEVSNYTAHLCQDCFNDKCMPKEVELTIVPLNKNNAKKESESNDRS